MTNSSNVTLKNLHKVDEINYNLIESIKKVTNELGLRESNNGKQIKPWFDNNCKNSKRNCAIALKNCKKTKFLIPDLNPVYNKEKKEYKKIVRKSKLGYKLRLIDELRKARRAETY